MPKIAQLREKAGLTQKQVADAIGATESTVRNLEKGRNGLDHIDRIVRLCRILNCQVQDLIDYVPVDDEDAQTGL